MVIVSPKVGVVQVRCFLNSAASFAMGARDQESAARRTLATIALFVCCVGFGCMVTSLNSMRWSEYSQVKITNYINDVVTLSASSDQWDGSVWNLEIHIHDRKRDAEW